MAVHWLFVTNLSKPLRLKTFCTFTDVRDLFHEQDNVGICILKSCAITCSVRAMINVLMTYII